MQFDHAHIARTVDFGKEGDEYAFVSEYPRGETTEQWVGQNGRMPPEAVLRIALQVVSAIGAAAYHQIFHADIRPVNLVITPGQTAEGGWPSVKLTNLATGGIGASVLATANSSQFASPEQMKDGTVDLRSEIYSLGATMCFLLTGAFYSAEPRSLQTRRFARPLRKLIQPMLRQNPNERPQDPVVLTETLRSCLEAVERRQLLAGRVGIPFLAVQSRPAKIKPPKRLPKQILAPIGGEISRADVPEEEEPDLPVGRRWSPAFAIAAAVLLGLGIIGAAIVPARHLFFAHENKDKSGDIGVPIGVSQPAPVWDGKPLVMNKNRIPSAATAQASAAPSVPAASNSVAAEQPAAAVPASSPTPPTVAQVGDGEPSAPAAGPQSVWEKAGNRPLSERMVSKDGVASASSAETPDDNNKVESSQESKAGAENRIVSRANDQNDSDAAEPRKQADNSENVRPRLRPGVPVTTVRRPSRSMTGRGSVARIASDGSVILRLPNGEIAVLPPPRDEYPVRRYHRPRRTVVAPQQPSGYPYYQGD